MSFHFEAWPFLPPHSWTVEQAERWWRECYLPHPAEITLQDSPQWLILRGGYQSGKSTALEALRRERARDSLILKRDFSIDRLPVDQPANLLHWIMQTASWALREHLTRHPELFDALSHTQCEFLRWSIEKFHQTRAFTRWLDGLSPSATQKLQVAFTDLYPTQTTTSDVGGQIEELVNLCTRIGFERILVTIDVPPFPDSTIINEIDEFLRWLEPMQYPPLQVVVALPLEICTPDRLELTRSRAKIIDLSPSEKHIDALLQRYLWVATSGEIQHLEQVSTKEMLLALDQFLEQEFGYASPGAWINFLNILLEKASHLTPNDQTLPLDHSCTNEAILGYYRLFLPLRKADNEDHLGVWRGHRWIRLDRASYDFLMQLFSNKGKYVDHVQTQKKKANLHTLARRVRVAIEPDPSNPIYLLNDRGEGYWIEHFSMKRISMRSVVSDLTCY